MPDAFQETVEAFYENLYKFALSLSRSRDDAWDLTQQTFLVWATKGKAIRNPSATKSWLYTTLYREFLKTARRQKIVAPYNELEDEAIEQSNTSVDQIRSAEAADVMNALMRLKDNYRQVVALYFLESYTYDEISKILEIPIGTVMSRLSRGKEKLKTLLSESTQSSRVIEFIPQPRQSHG